MTDRRFKAAVAALNGMLANPEQTGRRSGKEIVHSAVIAADELIAELERTDPGKPVSGTEFVDSIQPKIKLPEPREWMLYFSNNKWYLSDSKPDAWALQYMGSSPPFHWVRVREVTE